MAARRSAVGIGVSLALLASFDGCWVWKKIPELESKNETDASFDAGADLDANVECDADFGSDPGNCGSCGHDCLGGSCEQGVCQPHVLASGQAYPTIALDTSGIYLANESGTIVRREPDGTLTTLAQNQTYPQRIAVDATHFYFGTGEIDMAGGLHRMPKTGCTNCVEDIMVDVGGVGGVVVESDFVYFTDASGGNVWRAKKGSVCGTPDAGSADCEIFASGLATPAAIQLVDSFFYVLCVGTPGDYIDGQIVRIPKNGCSGVTDCPLVLAADQNWPSFIAATSERIYWSTYKGGTTMMVPADGSGAPFELGNLGSAGIDVDATHVYWGTRTDNAGAIRRALLDGNEITFVATGLGSVYDLRLAENAIYFSTKDSLMVLAR